jgi:hypothetical protein
MQQPQTQTQQITQHDRKLKTNKSIPDRLKDLDRSSFSLTHQQQQSKKNSSNLFRLAIVGDKYSEKEQILQLLRSFSQSDDDIIPTEDLLPSALVIFFFFILGLMFQYFFHCFATRQDFFELEFNCDCASEPVTSYSALQFSCVCFDSNMDLSSDAARNILVCES